MKVKESVLGYLPKDDKLTAMSFFDNYLTQLQEGMQLREAAHSQQFSVPHITVKGKSYLNFASNDYLGLSTNQKLKDGAIKWIDAYGTGLNASRLMGASLEEVVQLEEKLAKAKKMPRAVIMGSGFLCNVSVLAALLDENILGKPALVYGDKLNHASIYGGVRMAGASLQRYRHLDYDHLTSLLEKDKDKNGCRFILSDTLFSMDGDCADIPKLNEISKNYNALLFLDDAHAFGTLGEGGYGLAQNMEHGVVTATFGKAWGCYGAVCFCDENVYRLLWQRAGGLVYATAPPPSVIGAIDAANAIMPSLNDARARLKSHRALLVSLLKKGGMNCLSEDETPILPIIVGESTIAMMVSRRLYERGFFVPAIRPPTVPPQKARLRISLSAAHSAKHINALAETMVSVMKECLP